MKAITKYLNKFLCITLSTTLLTSQIVFATTGLPEQIENAAYIPLSDNFLPSDERHAFAPPIEGVSAELTTAETELTTALDDASSLNWSSFSYNLNNEDTDIRAIFYNAFLFEYYKYYLEYFE